MKFSFDVLLISSIQNYDFLKGLKGEFYGHYIFKKNSTVSPLSISGHIIITLGLSIDGPGGKGGWAKGNCCYS